MQRGLRNKYSIVRVESLCTKENARGGADKRHIILGSTAWMGTAMGTDTVRVRSAGLRLRVATVPSGTEQQLRWDFALPMGSACLKPIGNHSRSEVTASYFAFGSSLPRTALYRPATMRFVHSSCSPVKKMFATK